MSYIIENLDELNEFAKVLAKNLEPGDVYYLNGDLGAGKTTLVQMIGRQMGIEEYITSPTFALVNIYDNDPILYHLDLYRLNKAEELENIDFETYFYPDGVTFIEWADKAGDYLPEDIIEIEIEVIEGNRKISLLGDNPRVKDLEGALNEDLGN